MRTLGRECSLYLFQLLHHFPDAQISVMAHLVLHLGQPVTELFVFVIEDGPGVEAVGNFLPAQGHLGRAKVGLGNCSHMEGV